MSKIYNTLKLPKDIKYINGLSTALYFLFVFIAIVYIVQIFILNKTSNLSAIIVKGDITHTDINAIRKKIPAGLSGNLYSIDLLKIKHSFEMITWINQATIKRVYPNIIEVKLSEYKSKAIWGNRDNFKLVDEMGIIFEGNTEEDEYELLPIFIGPEGQSKSMLDMHATIVAIVLPLKQKLKVLELTARGSWIITLDGGGRIELGMGNKKDIIERFKLFSDGVENLLGRINKKLNDIEYVDLRHTDGYAMRMRGVSTSEVTVKHTNIKN